MVSKTWVKENKVYKGNIMAKENCWECFKCGRQPGGEKVSELGECVASTEKKFNGINNGQNGGRICWAVSGTFCGGKVQGTSAEKMSSCMLCPFYKKVFEEEGDDIVMLPKE